MLVLIAYSSSAHRNLDLLSNSRGTLLGHRAWGTVTAYVSYGCPARGSAPTYRWSAAVSSGPDERKARGNARRRSARSRHSGTGCRCAPRPGSVPRGSGTQASPTAVTRSRSRLATRSRHPTQVRSGHDRPRVRPDTSKSTPLMVITSNPLPGRGRVGAQFSSRVPSASTSGRMSIRQPVSRAASRAFWPSLPIASDSW